MHYYEVDLIFYAFFVRTLIKDHVSLFFFKEKLDG